MSPRDWAYTMYACALKLILSVLRHVDLTDFLEFLALLVQTHVDRLIDTISVLSSVFSDIFGDAHGAELGTAHGAEVSHLPGVRRDGLVVHGASGHRIQRQVELIVPSELESGLGQGVVPLLGVWVSLAQIRSMCCNLVRNHTCLDIISVWQTQMFLGRNVAQQSSAQMTNVGGANGRGDVVVSWRNIGHQRTQSVEWRLIAPLQLVLHVFGDLVQRNVAWTFVHDLHVVLPRTSGQVALSLEFGKLGLIIGVIDRTRSQAITNRERHIVFTTNLANLVPVLISKVLLVMGQAPLGVD
mmetsp:Transcript_7691/g.13557  ORF Transcript_7691/g.13557 Transcript_7691/m.13557 type:complete len:298 (-) Transcript_7691:27-920(-)